MIVAATGHQVVAALCGLAILFVTMLGPKVLEFASAWLEANKARPRRSRSK
jgi:hypothetical protein